MLNRLFTVDTVTLTSTGTAVSNFLPYDMSTRKLPTQVVIRATGQGAYVRLSDDKSAATNADLLVQAGDHAVVDVLGRHWVSVLSDGASSTVSIGALSTGVWGDAATLNLNFTAGTLDPRITFTRADASTCASYFDQNGVLRLAAANVARFDYDPATLAAQGLLIEESRTNSIRNNTMVGAVAGTPGTAPTNWSISTTGATTVQIVGTGTENGITYIDYRLQGTGAADGWNLIYDSSVVAANGQSWTGSIYLKLVGGSTANLPFVQRLAFRDSGFANIQPLDSSALAPTGAGLATQRNTISLTATQATTAFVTLQLNSGTPTGAYNITLRIGLPQLELGAFATSVIPTTTTALTRSADVASVNTLSPWFNATEGTLFAEITASANANTVYAALNNGTITQNSTYFDNDTGSIRAVTFSSGSAVAALGLGAIGTAGAVNKLASAYKVNDFAAVRNGGTVQTDALGAVPVSVSQLDLGRNPSGLAVTYISGYIRRITYYPRRLENNALQALTL